MEAEDLGPTETNHKSLRYVRVERGRVVRFNTQSQEARHQIAPIVRHLLSYIRGIHPPTMEVTCSSLAKYLYNATIRETFIFMIACSTK